MKICLVVSDFPPRLGGISTFNKDLAEGLAKRPDVEHVLVIALQRQGRGIDEISSKLTVRRMPLGSMWRAAITLAKELAAARGYDVFHSPNVFPVGFLTLCIGKYFLRKPVVITFHGTDVLASAGSRGTRILKRFTVLHASVATTVSYSTRMLVAAQYKVPEERFFVVYYMLPAQEAGHYAKAMEDIRAAYGYAPEDIIVLTVSTLVKRKGTDDIVRALALVPQPRVKLLIVGEGPERQSLEALVKELQLQSRVQLAGRVSSVDPFYHAADMFALASYYVQEEGDIEGLGIVLLEAQQHGLPVIGTRSGGIPEALLEGESGCIVPERDVPALARCIETLAADKPLRVRMGERGKAFVAERFSVEQNATTYAALYRNL